MQSILRQFGWRSPAQYVLRRSRYSLCSRAYSGAPFVPPAQLAEQTRVKLTIDADGVPNWHGATTEDVNAAISDDAMKEILMDPDIRGRGKLAPESPSFYTGRAPYYDTMTSLQMALGQIRATLKTLQLLPLPPFARASLLPMPPLWKNLEEMSSEVGMKLNTTRYRRLLVVLNELHECLRIATTASHTELADMIEQVVAMFERGESQKEEYMSRGKRTIAELDEFGRSYTLGRRKTSSARVWIIPVQSAQRTPKPEAEVEQVAAPAVPESISDAEFHDLFSGLSSQEPSSPSDTDASSSSSSVSDEVHEAAETDRSTQPSFRSNLDNLLQTSMDSSVSQASLVDQDGPTIQNDSVTETIDESPSLSGDDPNAHPLIDDGSDTRIQTVRHPQRIASNVKPVDVPTTTILVNNLPLSQYFPKTVDRERVVYPLKVAGVLGKFNIFTIARGGGSTGQTGAIAHGIAKGLLAHDQELLTILRKANLIKRDPRMVERKKTGLAKARKRYTWVKR
ncbi:ribosomal protein S9/S16-domain-containing protein [Armillaria luteobubalina]|uniref:Ribosomal protein S9/S16-domain-containing protein n=1 Tax=Armillaria luteobubalina TaxID=153913 RepID=A0AA39V426_9AGAR|nr:ribosomal protein S9/S16-domain-containing protein [Armillaria luteobubalina]